MFLQTAPFFWRVERLKWEQEAIKMTEQMKTL